LFYDRLNEFYQKGFRAARAATGAHVCRGSALLTHAEFRALQDDGSAFFNKYYESRMLGVYEQVMHIRMDGGVVSYSSMRPMDDPAGYVLDLLRVEPRCAMAYVWDTHQTWLVPVVAVLLLLLLGLRVKRKRAWVKKTITLVEVLLFYLCVV
jgi:hypothetical protein